MGHDRRHRIKPLRYISISLFFMAMFSHMVFFSSCAGTPDNRELAEAYFNLGNAYTELGRYRDAGVAYAKAVEIDPVFYRASYNLGRVYIDAGQIDRGISVLEELLLKDPNNALTLEAIAWAYHMKKDGARVIEFYLRTEQADPLNKNALYNLGLIYYQREQWEESYKRLKKLADLGEKEGSLFYRLGTLEKKLGISAGFEYFEKAAELSSTDPKELQKILKALLESYHEEKLFGDAVAVYDRLIKASGEDPSLFFNKAYILLVEIEDYPAGLDSLEKALSLGFSDRELIDALIDEPDLLNRSEIVRVLRAGGISTPGM